MRIPQPKSLQGRLAARLGMVFLALLAAVSLSVAWRFSMTGPEMQRKALGAQFDELVASLSTEPGSREIRVRLPPATMAKYNAPGRNYLYRIWDLDGQEKAASGADARSILKRGTAMPGEAYYFDTVDAEGKDDPTYAMTAFADTPIGPMIVSVGQDKTHDEDLLDRVLGEFEEDLLSFGLVIGLVAGVIGIWTIRSSLGPIAALSARAATIEATNLDARLSDDSLPMEIRPLVTAFDGALDRLKHSFAAQQRLTANAAHQLRTPLAVMTARLDAHESGQEIAGLRGDVERMTRIVSQLLSAARLENRSAAEDEAVNLGRLAREAAAALVPMASRHGVELVVTGARDAVTMGRSLEISEALGNVIDNAIRHAPRDSEVEIVVGPGPRLVILDRGPGIRPEHRAQIFEPFWRRPDAPTGGTGLGLAIVREVMSRHGGSIKVEERTGGGAAFILLFAPGRDPNRNAANSLERGEPVSRN